MGANTTALMISSAPSWAMGVTYVAMARTIAEVMADAVVAQRNMQAIAAASTVIVDALIIAMGAAGGSSSSSSSSG